MTAADQIARLPFDVARCNGTDGLHVQCDDCWRRLAAMHPGKVMTEPAISYIGKIPFARCAFWIEVQYVSE